MADIDIVQEVEKELSSEKPTTNSKKKRTTKSLTMSERMRIIDDFRNGIPDKYYSVSAHPRKAGEYIVRKRKNPLTYDIERPVKDVPTNESITCMSASESTNETSKVPSEMLKSENPLAGTEFFSMYSNLNASLQRELDSLHEKFNKLDAKFRKERASRKNKSSRKKQQEQQEENDYEYEYVDDVPQAPPVDTIPMNPLHATRPRINIFDYF